MFRNFGYQLIRGDNYICVEALRSCSSPVLKIVFRFLNPHRFWGVPAKAEFNPKLFIPDGCDRGI